MMSDRLRKLYRRVRENPCSGRVGFAAVDALREARIRLKWDLLESAGYVRIETPYDDDADLSWLEQDCFTGNRGEQAYVKRIRELADREGCFGMVAEFRTDLDSEDWEQADSVWGFIGYDDVSEDIGRNPCAPDLMESAIEQFASAWRESVQEERDRRAGRCPRCHGTGRLQSA